MKLTRREALSGLAAALTLGACDRYDATSWVTRERFDVDRRFRESMDELPRLLAPDLIDDERWSALIISDLHFWEREINVHLEEVRRYVARNPVDLVFQLGDLADAGLPVEYQNGFDALDALGPPFYSAIGNHDVWNEGWANYRHHFGPSVYTLHLGTSLIITLDLAGGTLGGLQRPWLEEQLAAAEGEHIILLSHYPLWTPTSDGFSQIASEQEVYDILDLMRRYGVAAHLSGHTHRWAATEVDGSLLYTVSSLREGSGDRCGLRIDADGRSLSFTRVLFSGDDEDQGF